MHMLKNAFQPQRWLCIGLAVACTAITNGCRQSSSSDQNVNLGSFSVAVDYAPYLIGKDEALFSKALVPDHVTPRYTLFQSLPPINEAFATQKLDAVFEAEPPAIVGRAAGIDIKVVAVSCSLVQQILVPANSKIIEASGLKGKRIAVLAGTSSHYGLLKILRGVGLSKQDVEIIDMAPPDAKNAFETGRVDAWAVWPPWDEEEELSGTGRAIQGGDAIIYSIMAVRADLIREHRGVVQALVDTLQRDKTYLIANSQNSEQIVAQDLNVPLPVVQKAWPRHNWAAQISPAMIADIQAKADFLKENGFIQKSIDVKNELFDNSFAK